MILGMLGQAQAVVVIDQHNDGPFSGGFTLNAAPIGQGFIPGISGLDFVDLLVNDQNPGFGTGDDIAVRIRESDIAGTILGTSDNVFFADQVSMPSFQLPKEVRFAFSTTVALTPGNTYVIEIFRNGANSSDLGIFGTGFNIDSYVPGVSF